MKEFKISQTKTKKRKQLSEPEAEEEEVPNCKTEMRFADTTKTPPLNYRYQQQYTTPSDLEYCSQMSRDAGVMHEWRSPPVDPELESILHFENRMSQELDPESEDEDPLPDPPYTQERPEYVNPEIEAELE